MRALIRSAMLTLLLFMAVARVTSAPPSDIEVYLVTCAPGDETYSLFGHSAIRLVDPVSGVDAVYNWGVFDFSTPDFNYRFARGRLDYMLAVFTYKQFLQDYFWEERSVWIQRVNLNDAEIALMRNYIDENIRPENRYYRYDFFMDNCATRVRDLFESVLGSSLQYPEPSGIGSVVSYRERLGEYTGTMPWLGAGINLLIGSPGEVECDFRGSMFLPDYLMWNLSEALIVRDGVPGKLLGEPVRVLEFDPTQPPSSLPGKPWIIMAIAAVAIFAATIRIRRRVFHDIFDLLFFSLVAALSFLMIFANYLTDHQAMGDNYNIIWLNPLLMFAPFSILGAQRFGLFWRSVISLELVYLVAGMFINQEPAGAAIPLILIIITRAWYRLTREEHDAVPGVPPNPLLT